MAAAAAVVEVLGTEHRWGEEEETEEVRPVGAYRRRSHSEPQLEGTVTAPLVVAAVSDG